MELIKVKAGKKFNMSIGTTVISRSAMTTKEYESFEKEIEASFESLEVSDLRKIKNLKSKSQLKKHIRNLLSSKASEKSEAIQEDLTKEQKLIQDKAQQAHKDALEFARKQLISEMVRDVFVELKAQGMDVKIPKVLKLEVPKEEAPKNMSVVKEKPEPKKEKDNKKK